MGSVDKDSEEPEDFKKDKSSEKDEEYTSHSKSKVMDSVVDSDAILKGSSKDIRGEGLGSDANGRVESDDQYYSQIESTNRDKDSMF